MFINEGVDFKDSSFVSVTSDFLKINKRLIKEERKYFKLRTKLNKEEQTGDVFDYCRFSTAAE